MKSFKKLIRLRNQKVDEQRQYLAILYERIYKMEEERDLINYHLKNEQHAAEQSVEGILAYVHYATNMKVRLDQIERLYREAKVKYEMEQQKLQDLYSELKVLQIYESETQKEQEKKADRKQQAFLDNLYSTSQKHTLKEDGFNQ